MTAWASTASGVQAQADHFTASVAALHAGDYSIAIFDAGRVLCCERHAGTLATAKQKAADLLHDVWQQSQFDALAAVLDGLRTPKGDERRAALGLL